ncbi:putative mannose-6-phosphate isomerase YvyI [Clostridia bacterium]|nr:putative mannose-6-phosphate isomerase YvyI [Clostridia bacterium]
MILKLQPIFKDYYWGGVRLKEIFEVFLEKQALETGIATEHSHLAEVWEFACHMDGISKLSPAPLPKPSGDIMTLSLSGLNRKKLFGSLYNGYANFPFLVKFVDVAQDLPLQVNPNKDFASINEHQVARTEIWHILDCEENSEIIYGFKETISPELFKKALNDNTITEYLRKVKVTKGDTFKINPGTIHSVGKGITLVAIHESSNAYYPIYDFGRENEIGLPRQMQLEKALQVIDFTPSDEYLPSAKVDGLVTLGETEQFTVKLLTTSNFHSFELDGKTFHNIVILDGEGNISDIDEMLPAKRGDSFFIPACDLNYTLYGELVVLITQMSES